MVGGWYDEQRKETVYVHRICALWAPLVGYSPVCLEVCGCNIGLDRCFMTLMDVGSISKRRWNVHDSSNAVAAASTELQLDAINKIVKRATTIDAQCPANAFWSLSAFVSCVTHTFSKRANDSSSACLKRKSSQLDARVRACQRSRNNNCSSRRGNAKKWCQEMLCGGAMLVECSSYHMTASRWWNKWERAVTMCTSR